ncbi:hypothetical protein FKW77_005550 [Venturia effusa]|uniref:Major facilitator superfamily (MFS) profile domain-containing protein n=1 Tax=Venturia effusa TaxID=50376 RepID=A0A517LLI5_9PEZI|nr:hypothetical protein FKW77_005550 [Venturia effusa]
MVPEIPPHRRLTPVPSDEDLRQKNPSHTAIPSTNISSTTNDPIGVRHNAHAGPSGTKGGVNYVGPHPADSRKQETAHESWPAVTALPTSSPGTATTRPAASNTPLSMFRTESFYSCRDTSSPGPYGANDDESVYTQVTEDRRGLTPPPLSFREKSRSFPPSEIMSRGNRSDVSIFGSRTAETLPDIFTSSVDSSVHHGHRSVACDSIPERMNSVSRDYHDLISTMSREGRETPSTGEALADAAAAALEETRRKDEEEIESQMRGQQQKKISDTSTATAVSSPLHAPDRVDTAKKVQIASSSDPNMTVLESKSDGAPVPIEEEINYKTFRTFFMGVIVSMGGLIFGYGGVGQIGGFLNMSDYMNRFGNEMQIDGEIRLGRVRKGTIVGLLMIGALIGALVTAPITDRFGRKWCIALWAGVFIVGQVIEIATQRAWYQLVIGRTIEGLAIGGLSILTPLYMGEIAPKQIRGVMISCYQLFITTGILLASLVNLGTHKLTTPASWRITMGISLIWPSIMAIGVLFLDESPRWDYRKGNTERAERTIAKTYSVQPGHSLVTAEVQEIQAALNAETTAANVRWYDVFYAPTMLRRIAVGMTLQMLQQLTGINYFFSYATDLFAAAGVGDGYITAVILGVVNFFATFAGLWVAGNVGHRKALISGGLWISLCLFIYAAIGTEYMSSQGSINHTKDEIKTGGAVLVAFTCLAIVGFATTWGPLPWAVCAEIYPAQYRATSMAFSTASNWTFNFLIAFFTPFITAEIEYKFGFVFAAALLAGAVFAFAFVHETKDRSLEAIDQMILDGVKPWKSARTVTADQKGDA